MTTRYDDAQIMAARYPLHPRCGDLVGYPGDFLGVVTGQPVRDPGQVRVDVAMRRH
jgi:hypothetical protein